LCGGINDIVSMESFR